MRKTLCLIFKSILITQFCHAQNLDSIWKVYNDKTLSDTTRLKAILIISKKYLSNNPDRAIIIAKQELQFAQQTKQKKYECSALNYKFEKVYNEQSMTP